ncbi:acyl-CoA dehydrogenase family protein [Solirubrobacter taibaiensis]|nr:acyl-CoA dehydrogenase family protein [Solirubrobacter taibaiensis]
MNVSRMAAAERLERRLGDANDPANPFGFAAAVERDELGAFPDELAGSLRDAGLHLSFLPSALGGRLDGFDLTLALARVAARRDLNVMPATMVSVSAATCVLIAGSPAQQTRVAELLDRGATVAFALSEADCGSDVLRNACRLDEDADGFRLSGEKWSVGLGTRAAAVYLVARTGGHGPAAFSSVLLERDELPAGSVEVGAPLRVSGMRGIDFADYRFRDCPVPSAALVGRRGEGLQTAMCAQQVVRALSTAGNLACADTALRVALDFARERGVLSAPYPQRELSLAAAALLAIDASAVAAARALHVAPERFGLWSAVVKQIATTLSEQLIDRCGAVLGARSVIAEGPSGIFQKARRDNAVVRVIDTSVLGNLRSIAMQLLRLTVPAAADPDTLARLQTTFALDAELPEFAPERLTIDARARDDVLAGLVAVAPDAAAALGNPDVAGLPGRIKQLVADVARLRADAGGGLAGSSELLGLAERLARLHTAAACVHLWWFNRERSLFGADPGASGWLEACLGFLLEGTGSPQALERVETLHTAHQLFSATPIPLAPRRLHRAPQ